MTINKRANLVIVGSGPVGMVAALMFRKHFENVILLERQSKEAFLKTHGFTFPIVFSPASIKILKSIGIWEGIHSQRSEFFGVVVHKRILGMDFKFASTKEGVYSHWRNHAITKLYEKVVEEGIPVHFNARVESIDFDGNLCSEASLGDLPFDLLLGADGINSLTRKFMSKVHPGFDEHEFGQTFLDNWYAYRLPSRGAMREKFAGGKHFLASNVFVDNLLSAEEFGAFAREMTQSGVHVPLMANMTEFGKTPYLRVSEFEALGYRAVLFPVSALRVAARAVETLLAELTCVGTQREWLDRMMPRQELYDLLRYDDHDASTGRPHERGHTRTSGS